MHYVRAGTSTAPLSTSLHHRYLTVYSLCNLLKHWTSSFRYQPILASSFGRHDTYVEQRLACTSSLHTCTVCSLSVALSDCLNKETLLMKHVYFVLFRNCRIMSTSVWPFVDEVLASIRAGQAPATASQQSQGTQRAADATIRNCSRSTPVWQCVDAVLLSIRAVKTGQTAAEQSLQGTKRPADAALDGSNASKKARHINTAAAAADQSVRISTKRSATEALAPSNSSHEALGAADLGPSKKKQRNSNMEQLLPPSAPQASCVKRSTFEALAIADLEPKNKKHKSKNSPWSFEDRAFNKHRSKRVTSTSNKYTQTDVSYSGTIKRNQLPWYTQNQACMRDVFRFIGNGNYLVLATVCKAWCAAYAVDGPHGRDRRPGISQQSRSTYYQLLLHNDKLLKALWQPDMATSIWTDSDDGR
jgi:hypothetical protein